MKEIANYISISKIIMPILLIITKIFLAIQEVYYNKKGIITICNRIKNSNLARKLNE